MPGDDENTSTTLKVVLAPEWQHNLLGRDAILTLGLSIGPGPNQTLVVQKHTFTDTGLYVVEGNGQPYYSWSLDLPAEDPGQTSDTLLRLARQVTKGKPDFMPRDALHVTLRYKITPGPDPPYDDTVKKLGPQCVEIPYLYFNNGQTSFCDVNVSARAQALMAKSFQRHISLSKGAYEEWFDLGPERQAVVKITDWEPTKDPKIQYSPLTQWSRMKLNYRVTTTPVGHLTDD